MALEVFSLLDDKKQSSMRTDLTLPEIYKTRLLRVDLGSRSRADPFQNWIHKWLRGFRDQEIPGQEDSVALTTVLSRFISHTTSAARPI
ncbi:hypothetical protein F4680DRAFT_402068, partial [Xylaria scruposa]